MAGPAQMSSYEMQLVICGKGKGLMSEAQRKAGTSNYQLTAALKDCT